MYSVYKHICPNGKVYIGITSMNPIKRWKNGAGYKNQQLFYRAILKCGWDNIKHEILVEGLTKEQACEKEIELIALYKSNQKEFGYNIDNGGNCSGTKSKETRQKMSKAHIGKCHSEKTCKKMSEIASNRIGEKNGFYGKHHSEETKKKMSETWKRRKEAII